MHIITTPYVSLCGVLLLGAYEDRLCLCDWQAAKHHTHIIEKIQHALHADIQAGTSPVTEQAAAELDEYFSGKRHTFNTPLLLVGTDFQQNVWNELRRIPYGATISYTELAKRIEKPTAIRAVANAIGANTLSLFVPCHRVIGANGSLTGYAGGLATKKWLLEREK